MLRYAFGLPTGDRLDLKAASAQPDYLIWMREASGVAAAAVERAAAADQQLQQQQQQQQQEEEEEEASDFKRFCRAWAWKREHRPDRDRFHRPYTHALALPPPAAAPGGGNGDGGAGGAGGGAAIAPTCVLVIKQRKFGPEGFASTVWDSSIVLSKWAERWPARVAGRRCLDLSAGCGLVGIVLARLGAAVVATDLAPNLQLLRDNCDANAPCAVRVVEHRWGAGVAPLAPPFDYVFGCDLMYVEEAVPDLVETLRALASWRQPRAGGGGGGGGGGGDAGGEERTGGGGGGGGGGGTRILIAHGRNRGAEQSFLRACAGVFDVEKLPPADLDPLYQCSDVDVLSLTLSDAAAAAAAGREGCGGAAAAAATPAGAPDADAASGAAPATIESALKARSYGACLRILEAAGAKAYTSDPKTTATVLCPTDQAVAAFLSEMGLSEAELLGRFDLVDKLAAYHTIPRARAPLASLRGARASAGAGVHNASAGAECGSGERMSAFALSGDHNYVLRFVTVGGGDSGAVAVRDAQGRRANLVEPDADAGASVVHGVDAVLLSGEYFHDLEAFARFYRLADFSQLSKALQAPGAGGAASLKWGGTLFAPVGAALAAAALPVLGVATAGGRGGAAKAGADGARALRDVLLYWQLPEAAVYPGGFANGTAVATRLKGHTLAVSFSLRNATSPWDSTATLPALEGLLLPERGSPSGPAAIGLPNVHVARGIVHGVAGAPLPAPGGGAAGGAKAAAGRGRHERSGAARRLLFVGRGGGGGYHPAPHPSFGGGAAFRPAAPHPSFGGGGGGVAPHPMLPPSGGGLRPFSPGFLPAPYHPTPGLYQPGGGGGGGWAAAGAGAAAAGAAGWGGGGCRAWGGSCGGGWGGGLAGGALAGVAAGAALNTLYRTGYSNGAAGVGANYATDYNTVYYTPAPAPPPAGDYEEYAGDAAGDAPSAGESGFYQQPPAVGPQLYDPSGAALPPPCVNCQQYGGGGQQMQYGSSGAQPAQYNGGGQQVQYGGYAPVAPGSVDLAAPPAAEAGGDDE
ncbi:MAG: putative methyltransferase-domain-containing protein [Monoraphidium minutum]|nr:MAG: putative methyltransferase-domain-containing protein [Monoraphidium minutum]